MGNAVKMKKCELMMCDEIMDHISCLGALKRLRHHFSVNNDT